MLEKDVWWHFENDIDTIIFHDGSAEPDERLESPRLHHFRSWTLASEKTYLKNCWQKCLDSSVALPISRVKTYDTNGEPTDFIVHIKDLMTNARNKGDLHDTTEMSDESGSSNQLELLDNSTSEENYWDDNNITLHMTALSNVSDHMEDDCLVTQDMAEEIPQFYHDHSDSDQSKDCQTKVNQEVSSHNDIDQQENESERETSTQHIAILHSITNKECVRDSSLSISSSHNIKSSNALQTSVGQKTASNGYRCSIAKELSSLLGDTDNLKKFDKARSRLTDSPNSKVFITNYEQSLAKIQTETLGLYNRLSKQFKEWKKDYFMAMIKSLPFQMFQILTRRNCLTRCKNAQST